MGGLYLVKIEDEIQFADISEVLIQSLYKNLHEFKDDELVFILVDEGDEVETGVALVDDLVLFIIQKVAHLGVTSVYQLFDLHISPTLLISESFVFMFGLDLMNTTW